VEDMITVLTIVGIVVLGFIINIALKQSYNFLFIMFKKPLLWIVTIAVVAIAVWSISAAFKWGVSVPALACTIALFMNFPPRQKSANDKRTVQAMADELYSEMGIKHGRLLHRIGLAGFVLSCLLSWIALYGEVCSGGECQSIIKSIF
jgi:hypothetical protein